MRRHLIPWLLVLVLAASCDPPNPETPGEWLLLGEEGDFVLTVSRERGTVALLDDAGSRVFGSFGDVPFLTAKVEANGKIRETGAAEIVGLDHTGSRVDMLVRLSGNGADLDVGLRVERESPAHVALSIEPRGETRAASLTAHYFTEPSEALLGLGQRFDRVNHNGHRVTVEPDPEGEPTNLWDRLFAAGPANLPVPFYLSSRGYGLWVPGTHRKTFDFTASYRASVETHEPRMELHVFTGDDPLAIIENLTARSGRMTPLPDWATGLWVTIRGGAGTVRKRIQRLLDEGVPVSALWTPDWPIQPDVAEDDAMLSVVRDFVGHGAFVGTLCPIVPDDGALREEAQARGFVEKNDKEAVPDYTRPEVREWYAGRVKRTMLRRGVAGWFACPAGPETPACPEENAARLLCRKQLDAWTGLGREIIHTGGDPAVHLAAGPAGAIDPATGLLLGFLGRQPFGWDSPGGLRDTVTALTTAGISGVPFVHGTVGGNVRAPGERRGRELYLRWAELGSLSLIFRVGDGTSPGLLAFDADEETLVHVKDLALQRKKIRGYLDRLVADAAATGRPVMRHPYLVYPDDPVSLEDTGQFFLGNDVFVAPVFKDGIRRREVYFPKGRWVRLSNGRSYRGPSWRTLDAPVGEPLAFRRSDVQLP